MSAPTPTEVLQKYAHALQMAAPREWEDFLRCFDAYAHEGVLALVNSPQDQVLQQQGSSRAYLHLLRSFRDCANPRPQRPPSQTPTP